MPSSQSVARSRQSLAPALLLVVCVALLASLSIARIQPPDAVSAAAPPDQFSSARAMQHLQAITQKPHPVGSLEHARVRGYIRDQLAALGVAPEIQQTTAVGEWNSRSTRPIATAVVHNIVARLRGTENTRAIMLVAHYDSVPTAPGATDDGAGVVTLLETLRALKSQPALKNDVVFLFTDGEELGLLGAKAFADEHAWMKDAGLVLNFEGRGHYGPVMMFETSDRNGWLIREFARAAPHPVASSLLYAAYTLLPNDTDLTIFKRAGLPALNFAHTGGINHYHTALDTAAATHEQSLQHHGSYALALARHFGHLDLNERRRNEHAPGEPDAVYFNLFGSIFIHYTPAWAMLLCVLIALLCAGVVAYGFRTAQLGARQLAAGFLFVPCAVVLTTLTLTLAWWATRALHRGFDALPWGDPYNGHLYKLAFVLLAVSATSALYLLLRRKISLPHLAVGALGWWLGLLITTTLVLPAGSFLFAWPLLSSLAGVAFILATKDTQAAREQKTARWKHFAVHALVAAPAVLLGAPLLSMLLMMLGIGMAAWVLTLVVLLVALLVPQLDFVASQTGWLLPAASALVGAGLIIAGLSTAGFDARHRKTNSVFYALNTDERRAVWGSFDRAPDEWTSQFIPRDATRSSVATFFPWISRPATQAEAPVLPLRAPELHILEDGMRDGVRIVRARIASPRQAALVLVFADPSARVLAAAVNGKQIPQNAPPPPTSQARLQPSPAAPAHAADSWKLFHAAPSPEGFELILQLGSSAPLKLFVEDVSYELPIIPARPFKPRPDDTMPAPQFLTSETTIVGKSFVVGLP